MIRPISRPVSFFFAFFLVISLLGVAQNEPDWKWQNPLPTGNKLNDVQFIDNQTGWAVGSEGTILKTSDGGVTWNRQTSGTEESLNGVHFANAQSGWAVGEYGTILNTSDGGQTWQAQNSGTTDTHWSVHFTDSQTGWAVGYYGTIRKTSNGGQTWQAQSSGTTHTLSSVHFSDSQTGWAVGFNGTMLKTSNGGQTWQTQTSGTTHTLSSVHFSDSQTGWAVGAFGTILKTSNGGQTWQAQSSGTTNDYFTSVHFTDDQTGWVVANLGTIYKTINGGQTWQAQISAIDGGLLSVHFSDAQNGWVVLYNGTILKTSNGGQTWQAQSSGTTLSLQSVHFSNVQTGWAVGVLGTILKTNDAGQTWQAKSSGTTQSLYSVHFTDSLHGWAVGNFGTILKTTNGGQAWQAQSIQSIQRFNSVYFSDSQTGWVVGTDGTILKTSDGGQSWEGQTSGNTSTLRSVHFNDTQTGWVVGSDSVGIILKTINGGQTWEFQSSGTTNILSSVYFIDAQKGWAVGAEGTILKTSDGGQNWQAQFSGTYIGLSSVHFSDSQTGWVVGYSGTILKTSDGGQNWQAQISGTPNPLFSVHFTDPLHGWAVGDNGTILTTITNNYSDPETPTSRIDGILFEKTETICNPSNVLFSGKLVKAMPGPYYGISNAIGIYGVRVPLAATAQTFTLQPVINPNAFQFVCPPSGQISVTVDTIPDTLSGNNFGFEITPCHNLEVQLSSNRRRRCFRNSTAISFWNDGSLPANNAHVIVDFPHWIRPLSASRPHVAINDSVWRFNLGDVAPGSGGSFTIQDSVRCGNVSILGLSQCTKATIYPAPDCPSPSAWSGAEVSVSGRCENGLVKLGIYNRTSVNMPDSVDYWVYMDSIQVKVGKVKLLAGDSLKIQVVPNGMGVYLSVNQVANHPGQVFVTTAVEGCGFFPLAMSNAVSTHLPAAQLPNSKTQCLPIIGSYDPNDKQVFPIGFTNQNIIAPNTRLEYLLRFQNSGNDTAFTVNVIDYLDQNLNVESFEMGAASHPYQLTMQTLKSGKTFLRWQFNNINLPDSVTNEPASNGFIQFRISPKPGLALGSKVRNYGEIYFDFNPPIYTNQTLTTFDNLVFTNPLLNGNVQIITSAASKWSRSETIQVFPNPFSHSVNLRSETEETISVSFCDLMGRELFSHSFSGATELNLSHLSAGVYMLKFPGQNRVMKVVKE